MVQPACVYPAVRDGGNCPRSRAIPSFPKKALAIARHAGMANTARRLVQLRRVLNSYKTAPCSCCSDEGEATLPLVLSAIAATGDKAVVENTTLIEVANATCHSKGKAHGFIFAEPGPVILAALRFTTVNTFTFLLVKVAKVFGGKSLVVTCRDVKARGTSASDEIVKALAEITRELKTRYPAQVSGMTGPEEAP